MGFGGFDKKLRTGAVILAPVWLMALAAGANAQQTGALQSEAQQLNAQQLNTQQLNTEPSASPQLNAQQNAPQPVVRQPNVTPPAPQQQNQLQPQPAAPPVSPQPARTLGQVMADLSAGGWVILMRHANSPADQAASVGLTGGCQLQPGRGLDAKGFFQSRFIGEFLKQYNVSIATGYTSDMCRTWDTARLVGANAPVLAEPALKTTNLGAIDGFKAVVQSRLATNPGGNILLVSHSNIVPLYADWGSDGEIPSGLILIVDPNNWTVKDKINLDIDLSVE